jgi:ABC-type spermidine/putrescine transport system permease subunit I
MTMDIPVQGTHDLGKPAGTRPNVAELAADSRSEQRRILGLSLPSLLLVTALLLIPVGWLFGLSFFKRGVFTFDHYLRMVEHSSYIAIFQTTFSLSILVTLICVLLGYPVAYLLAQLPRRWATLGMALVILPFWTSLLVRTYAWLVLLQRTGVINTTLMSAGIIDEPLQLVHNYTGTVIGMTHIMLPFLILPLYASIKAIDMDYVRAASNLGASPTQAFLKIFLPLSLPGLIAGSLLVFIICLGFYVTPQILGGGRVTTVSMKIQQNIGMYFDWGAGSALGVALLVFVGLIFLVAHRLAGLERMFKG